MRLTLIAAAAMIGACGVAVAGAQAPTSLSVMADTSLKPADAPAGPYTMDSRHSKVTWQLRHNGVSIFTARFDDVSGKLNFDSASPAKSTIEATIVLASLNTGVLNSAGERAFDKEIATNFLGGGANPNATFKSTAIKVTGPQTGQITGDLTLNGVTKPVVLQTKFEGGRLPKMGNPPKHRIGFTAHTFIDRTAFGVSGANFDGSTSKEVEIIFTGEFSKD